MSTKNWTALGVIIVALALAVTFTQKGQENTKEINTASNAGVNSGIIAGKVEINPPGSQPRVLDEQAQEQLKKNISAGSTVTLSSVMGDGEAFNFATQIKSFLEKEGYKVDGVNQAVYGAPIQGQKISKAGDHTYEIVVGNKQ